MTTQAGLPAAALPEVDLRPVWSVVDVGGKLMHSNGRTAFQVMRVDDHDAAVDLVVVKAAAAVKVWRERAEAAGYRAVRA